MQCEELQFIPLSEEKSFWNSSDVNAYKLTLETCTFLIQIKKIPDYFLDLLCSWVFYEIWKKEDVKQWTLDDQLDRAS